MLQEARKIHSGEASYVYISRRETAAAVAVVGVEKQ